MQPWVCTGWVPNNDADVGTYELIIRTNLVDYPSVTKDFDITVEVIDPCTTATITIGAISDVTFDIGSG